MDALRIKGGARLRGQVRVGGAKNACLPAMAAALLAPGASTLRRVPDLADVRTLSAVLRHMGVDVTVNNGEMQLDATALSSAEAPYDLVRTMRASIMVLGPLVARSGFARVSLPGGCAIGARPIDQHLKGLKLLGADIKLSHGYVEARAPSNGLVGCDIVFDMPTVTGTENVMLAAALAEGQTRLINAAREPEVRDVARVLTSMGAHIEGAGTDTITIVGQTKLKPFVHEVVADRIECGTLLVAGALAGEPLEVVGGIVEHQEQVIAQLRAMGAGVHINADTDTITVISNGRPKPSDVRTAPYPGFPTDMQAQLMVLMTLAQGRSTVTETIFENRFMHVAELDRMGAHIRTEGRNAIIDGVESLSGATVMATDLRASASLVLAGLVAEGESVLRRVYHLDRGYEHLEAKLAAAGAEITRFSE